MTVGFSRGRIRSCRMAYSRPCHDFFLRIVFVVLTLCVLVRGLSQSQDLESSSDMISAWRFWWMQRLYELDHHHKQFQQALVQVAYSVLKNEKSNKQEHYLLPVKEWLVSVSSSDASWKQCRRIARVVKRDEGQDGDTKPQEDEKSDDNDDESVAVQIRDSGAVSEFGGSPFSFYAAEEQDDLFAGIMLQVYINNARGCKRDSNGVQLDHSVDQGKYAMIPVVTYELLEPIHMELGLVPKHALDFAYRPVVSSFAPNLGKTFASDSQGSPTASSVTKKTSWSWDGSTTLNAKSWWQWFLSSGKTSFSSFRNWRGDSSTNYERMGERAFAGGSHGEVWRARKKCLLNENTAQNQRESEYSGRHQYHEECSDAPLIMKRLKVEHGFSLLEAGLREIYFGSLLGQKESSGNRSTVYVDHFFREVSPPTFVSDSKKHLELWIVFEDAGASLRSYLYTPVTSGDFLIYQHSPFWIRLRMDGNNDTVAKDQEARVAVLTEVDVERSKRPHILHDNEGKKDDQNSGDDETRKESIIEGKVIVKSILLQILEAASFLHEHGIVHRDIKPSNVMCKGSSRGESKLTNRVVMEATMLECVLGDFSSGWDHFTSQNLYANGPSAQEQTDAYAPPEALFGPTWIPFHEDKPQSYDSWSIGVLALELLLGTPNVFSVDQRTTALLTNKMTKEGASDEEIQRALFLAALSQFCIYVPSADKEKNYSWPLRHGDPLHNVAMVKQSCTIQDFHHALRTRDPLGLGFDSTADPLLQLIWGLLAWDPLERLTAAEALEHPYFKTTVGPSDLVPGKHNALESQMLDPRMDFRLSQVVEEFSCPKCGRKFDDWQSCSKHANVRRHAKFCNYDTSTLPTCLNAHSMLPAHPTSGYCDIQGRRRVMEDFHAVQLHPTHQYYGMFDGHTGNLASKFVASMCYKDISEKLSDLDERIEKDEGDSWKSQVEVDMGQAFADIHDRFLEAVSFAPLGLMDQSGTTATILFVTQESNVVVASLGDSRAVFASSNNSTTNTNDFSAIQLTIDHVASDPAEKKMVEERGGFVSSSGGIDRVNGTLAVTRSIGDANLAPVLSRVPHVVSMDRTELKDLCGNHERRGEWAVPCFLVLASDGLWDVMTNQEAVDMVSQVVQKYDSSHGIRWEEGGAFQEAAQMLTQEAYVRGSTDNIGVCVVAIE